MTTVEGGRCLRSCRERAFQVVAQRVGEELAERGRRVRTGSRIGRVGFDEQRGTRATHQVAREIGGDFHHEGHIALVEHLPRDYGRVRRLDDLEIGGVLKCRHDRVGVGPRIGDRYRGRQVLGVEVDREAEQEDLHHRHAHDHRQSEAVAAHLDDLLVQHRGDAAEREAVAHGALPMLSSWSWMKTSSRLGTASWMAMPGLSR